MLRFLFAFVICCFFLPKSSLLVNADFGCPPANVISPCYCTFFTTNTTQLYCKYLNLNDSQASDILDAYLNTPGVSPVGDLELSFNRLTRVPVQVKSFTQLHKAYFGSNSISSIESGAFNASDDANPLQHLDLGFNKLTTIAPGAFKGIKSIQSYTVINLDYIELTRFESTVFQSLLEAMASFGGNLGERTRRTTRDERAFVRIENNPFDCSDCHLTWLIRDNRRLLPAVLFPTCSNGSTFEALNPSGFENCPAFSCPLGYDGAFADPLSCTSYYICRANVAYKSDCPGGLVFNPDDNLCDVVENVPQCQFQ